MTLEELIKAMTPEIYQNMRSAIELGRWPDGRKLDEEQRALCMEAVIYYEQLNDLPASERVGYMEDACKSEGKHGDDDVQTLTIQ
ncbi:YeaC family protein [Thalassolituus marinus]|uniref:DUF1315 family protein n=1 Tax=Thalassolituus marinus TaxID=671053 RepID=A0ABS7ZTI3_9GAMM|nr:DUF1315 family protein [Thalassolituus marinus]MCA6064902.1 DUF1315 family protein [Thalassolituus marinus]